MCEDVKAESAHESMKDILSKHQRSAAYEPHDRADAEIHQVLHDDVAGVLCPGETSLAHCESGLHPEDEGSSDEEPDSEDLAVKYFQNICCKFHNNIPSEMNNGVSRVSCTLKTPLFYRCVIEFMLCLLCTSAGRLRASLR